VSFFGNFPVVLFVELHIYNTVVLGLLFFLGAALPAAAHVTQHCTVGFYKNHPQFLNSGTCTNFVFNQSTLVSALFPDVDPCVGALTLLQLLQGPTTVCGTGDTIPGAEIILLRQAISRLGNAANSSPPSCDALFGTIHKVNATIDEAISIDNRDELIVLSRVYDSLNQGVCTLH
jgi:hypothetical protein